METKSKPIETGSPSEIVRRNLSNKALVYCSIFFQSRSAPPQGWQPPLLVWDDPVNPRTMRPAHPALGAYLQGDSALSHDAERVSKVKCHPQLSLWRISQRTIEYATMALHRVLQATLWPAAVRSPVSPIRRRKILDPRNDRAVGCRHTAGRSRAHDETPPTMS